MWGLSIISLYSWVGDCPPLRGISVFYHNGSILKDRTLEHINEFEKRKYLSFHSWYSNTMVWNSSVLCWWLTVRGFLSEHLSSHNRVDHRNLSLRDNRHGPPLDINNAGKQQARLFFRNPVESLTRSLLCHCGGDQKPRNIFQIIFFVVDWGQWPTAQEPIEILLTYVNLVHCEGMVRAKFF